MWLSRGREAVEATLLSEDHLNVLHFMARFLSKGLKATR